MVFFLALTSGAVLMNAVADQSTPTLKSLVAPNKVGMLVSSGGRALVSRPVTTLAVEGADSLWFMIAADSAIAAEVTRRPRVCLSYIDEAGAGYLSLRGGGSIVCDRERIQSLWNPMYADWSAGFADPNIALLLVVVTELEFWDTPASTVGRLVALTRSIWTDDSDAIGSHRRGMPS
jgi:general stress protein 26